MQLLHTHKHTWTVTTSHDSERKNIMLCIYFFIFFYIALVLLHENTSLQTVSFSPLSHLLFTSLFFSLLYVSWLLPLSKLLILKSENNKFVFCSFSSLTGLINLFYPQKSFTQRNKRKECCRSNLTNKPSMNYLSLWATKEDFTTFLSTCNLKHADNLY